MTNTNDNMMTAMFRNHTDADNAYQELLNRGYSRDNVSVLMSEDTRNQYSTSTENSNLAVAAGNNAGEGTGIGAAVGGTVGAIVAAVAAIGTSILLPGLGLIVAGPLAAALAGAGAGGATGGIIGALIGAGIPKETVENYEAGLKEGGVVLGFRPNNSTEAEEVKKVWQSYNAENINM